MSAEPKRVCLLTGASGRLGAMFCRLYGHRYEIVAVHCTRPIVPPPGMCWRVDPRDPARRVPAEPGAFASVQADLGDAGAARRVVDFALERFGRVDVLVNAAAQIRRTPLVALPAAADLSRMLHVNVVAPLALAVELARRYWRSRGAENTAANRNVINVSSTSGAYVFEGAAQGGYSTAKAALNMLSFHMAEEFAAFGVRVNLIAPDTFPQLVTTERVCDAVARLDRGADTGRMLLVEAGGETLA
jgi:NAD(P)-dependent dehydrogenase (short-subunit alcohol dehydrogenase family)